MKKIKLLIHHHAVAYLDVNNQIHLPSFIGRWINALAPYFGEIGLLLYESEALRLDQDEIIKARNIKLWSLGHPGKVWDRLQRIQRLKRVCAFASEAADGLLIRGVTPRQMDIWNAILIRNKAFILVGSLFQTRPKFQISLWGVYGVLMWYWGRVEIARISNQGILMANSPLLIDELAQLKCKASFVPTNSIRIDEFSSFHVRELSNPRKLLFCGRVVEEKGVIELIYALAELNESQPCMLDIVGPVNPSFYKKCKNLISRFGISGNVTWHGRVPYGNQLLNFYRQADVFILPTYFEGFPHVIWEAAASCCPVVATATGGIPSLFVDRKHCLLVNPKKPMEIAEAVTMLFSDFELRKKIIYEAYQLATDYTVESCARRLYETLSDNWK